MIIPMRFPWILHDGLPNSTVTSIHADTPLAPFHEPRQPAAKAPRTTIGETSFP